MWYRDEDVWPYIAGIERDTPIDHHQMEYQADRFLHPAGVNISRRFCVTEKGRMATVPPKCKEGDAICIIKGARMPYILRREVIENRKLCRLVGNTYIHGVMDGEIKIENPEKFIMV